MELLVVHYLENDTKECFMLESHSGNCTIIIFHVQHCFMITLQDYIK